MNFVSKCGLTRHSKKHDPNRVYPHKCPVCTRGFTQAQEMRQHVLRVHADQQSIEVVEWCAAIKAAAIQAREVKKKEAWRKRQISMQQTKEKAVQLQNQVGSSNQLNHTITGHKCMSW